MKNVQSIIFRGLSFLLVGLLMLSFPAEKTTTWLVRIIGALFLIPGMVSIATFFKAYSSKDSTRMLLPVIGVGSIILGVILISFPEIFITALMYVLAAALLLAGISGFVSNLHIRNYIQVGFAFYIVPTLMCLVGLFIIIKPWEAVTIPFIIFGAASIVYGLAELIYAIRFRKVYNQIANKKAQATEVVDAEVVEVAEETPKEEEENNPQPTDEQAEQ